MKKAIFEIEGLCQVYSGRTVLTIPRLHLPEGGIVGVSGHNGCGKSTLLRILSCLEAPAQGFVRFDGRPCGPDTPGVRRSVTLLTQEPYLLKRTVLANVTYGLRVRGANDIEAPVREAMEMVGLPPDEFLRRSWRELSGGEAQRVALASRLALRPKALLLDEPTSSLDPESAERIHAAVVAAREQWGTTLVAVSHDREWLEAVSDGIILFKGGRILHAPKWCNVVSEM